jgi:ubiquinone/menaquinone biosynthesis C-methylase UbiE
MSASDQFFTDGAAYERLMGRWSRRVGDIFVDWIGVPKNLSWIDIGCGTGVFTEQLIRHCSPAAVSAVDPSAAQMAFARDRTDLKMVEFHAGDAQDLPFPDNRFDVAVMALVIHFVPDPGKAIGEMARVLRPGGWAASYVWDYSVGGSPTAPLAAAIKAIGLESRPPPSRQATSMPALQQLWRSANLDQIDTRAIRIPVEFADFNEFWNSITAPGGPSGKTIAEMSPSSQQDLRKALQERTGIMPDGRVAYEACANAIKGRKTI